VAEDPPHGQYEGEPPPADIYDVFARSEEGGSTGATSSARVLGLKEGGGGGGSFNRHTLFIVITTYLYVHILCI
jgi:hypothetical protein